MRTEGSGRFLVTIYRIWMMRHADVPEEIVHALVKEMASGGAGSRKKCTADDAQLHPPSRVRQWHERPRDSGSGGWRAFSVPHQYSTA